MTNENSVYVAWQDPDTRDWHVVGNLQERNTEYVFRYTKGALKSPKFTKFSGMNDVHGIYVSEELFPLFKNRLLSPKRPEYPQFIKWLGFDDDAASPLNILARSGGIRSTDQLQIFKRIEFDTDGRFEYFFFLHSLGYLGEAADKRVSELKPGEVLRLCPDPQNTYDVNAVLARADSPAQVVGYCPRYLADEIRQMLNMDPTSLTLTVEKISASAPYNYRLLCKLSGNSMQESKSALSLNSEFETIG